MLGYSFGFISFWIMSKGGEDDLKIFFEKGGDISDKCMGKILVKKEET